LKFHPKHEKRQNLRQSETDYENITNNVNIYDKTATSQLNSDWDVE
jgi:hypothetical protein